MTQDTVAAIRYSDNMPSAQMPGLFVDVAKLARWRVQVIVVIAIVIATQLVIFPSFKNLAASGLVLLGNVLGLGYALRQSTLRRYPISSLMLLGYIFSYFTVPPLGQLVGLQPIIHHLSRPVADLAYAMLGLMGLIGGHLLYRNAVFPAALRSLLQKYFYGRLGFYRSPRLSQLWLMGFVGVIAIIAGRHSFELHGGLLAAIMQGLRPFVYVPYITLLLPLWSPPRPIPRLQNPALVAYTGVLLVLAMVANSRSYLLIGFASLAIAYFYLIFIGKVPVPKLRPRALIFLIVTALLVTGPLANLSMAMVLVRGMRSHLSPTQLVVKTWNIYLHGNVAQRFDQLSEQWASAGGQGVSENYFDNLFLNRLANLKFLDNASVNSQKLSPEAASDFVRIEWLKVMSIIPDPFLHALGVHADKKYVVSGSAGDFLLYEATGNTYVIGGFRTGSLLVNMGLIFGWAWPFALALLVMLVFAVVDAWVKPMLSTHKNEWTVRFNPLIIGMMFTNTFFLTSAATGVEDVSGIFGVLIRSWVQIGVLYAVFYWLTLVLADLRKYLR